MLKTVMKCDVQGRGSACQRDNFLDLEDAALLDQPPLVIVHCQPGQSSTRSSSPISLINFTITTIFYHRHIIRTSSRQHSRWHYMSTLLPLPGFLRISFLIRFSGILQSSWISHPLQKGGFCPRRLLAESRFRRFLAGEICCNPEPAEWVGLCCNICCISWNASTLWSAMMSIRKEESCLPLSAHFATQSTTQSFKKSCQKPFIL